MYMYFIVLYRRKKDYARGRIRNQFSVISVSYQSIHFQFVRYLKTERLITDKLQSENRQLKTEN